MRTRRGGVSPTKYDLAPVGASCPPVQSGPNMARTLLPITGFRSASSRLPPYMATCESTGTISAAGATGTPGRGGIVQPAAAATASAAREVNRNACLITVSFRRLADVAVRAHAGPVRLTVLFVVLAVLVEPVERAATRADKPADGRALASTRAAACDGSAGRADHGARHRTDGAVLHRVHGLVTTRHLRGRPLIARGDDGLRRNRGRRCGRRRGGGGPRSRPGGGGDVGGLLALRALTRPI